MRYDWETLRATQEQKIERVNEKIGTKQLIGTRGISSGIVFLADHFFLWVIFECERGYTTYFGVSGDEYFEMICPIFRLPIITCL